jgi:pyruvate formate lyase activating enzyme
MLDGVVITGGEPTMSPGLHNFIKKIKSLGFAVKLDTNGTHPNLLRKLIAENLLDYIAVDLKAPPEKHHQITQSRIHFSPVLESIDLVKVSNVPHEFRTTLFPLLTAHDLIEMSHFIKKENWFWQQFQPRQALDVKSRKLKPLKLSEINKIADEIKPFVNVIIRGE